MKNLKMVNLSTEEVVAKYQGATGYDKEDLLTEVFARVEGMVTKMSNNYKNIPNVDLEDKQSILKYRLLKIAEEFDITLGNKVTTVCNTYFTQELDKLYKRQTRQKRHDDDIVTRSYDELVEIAPKDKKVQADLIRVLSVEDYKDADFYDMIDTIGLTENENLTCRYTVEGLTKSEIARAIGVTPAQIKNYLNNIGKKMVLQGCC